MASALHVTETIRVSMDSTFHITEALTLTTEPSEAQWTAHFISLRHLP